MNRRKVCSRNGNGPPPARRSLEKEGVEAIEAVGQEFDPNLHQAVMQAEDENYGSNIVVEEMQKGYKLKDRVIRPSMVKVNQ